jgi:hypothetical protein
MHTWVDFQDIEVRVTPSAVALRPMSAIPWLEMRRWPLTVGHMVHRGVQVTGVVI